MIVVGGILGLAVLVAAALIAIYNSLVRRRNLVREGWSGIDVQLKRRADLIPNLIETVKGYMRHESDLLQRVTALRTESLNARSMAEKARAEGSLSRSLANVLAVAEGYPQLKASGNFRDLQAQLAAVEEDLQLARRYYNGAVRDLNIRVESFPGNLVASFFGFRQAEFFEIEDPGERNAPRIEF